MKDFWAFAAWGLAIYLFAFYAPDREEVGFNRGLCASGMGLTSEALEYCHEIHP